MPAPGGGAWSWRGVSGGDPPGTATAAGGTHPTAMHSCYFLIVLGEYYRRQCHSYHSTSVIRRRNGSETFLPCSIPEKF